MTDRAVSELPAELWSKILCDTIDRADCDELYSIVASWHSLRACNKPLLQAMSMQRLVHMLVQWAGRRSYHVNKGASEMPIDLDMSYRHISLCIQRIVGPRTRRRFDEVFLQEALLAWPAATPGSDVVVLDIIRYIRSRDCPEWAAAPGSKLARLLADRALDPGGLPLHQSAKPP